MTCRRGTPPRPSPGRWTSSSWDALTFVHWRVAPERAQALLPPGLEVDVYDGSAWVGLTPFVMGNMRPLGVPDLPGSLRVPGSQRLPRVADVSSTPETNLRTYVRGPDGRDGLWFLTIDAGSTALSAVYWSHRSSTSLGHCDGRACGHWTRTSPTPSACLAWTSRPSCTTPTG
ncbi:DUF2071 domain-containing protein [Nocardioides sp. zg-536]|uniref:DUF2071 domain-containing protein n=1 Tax=Nocardioides faecalis TaxID=2803858 RepID=A0A938Y6J1_9ACTN|nr:DUF2071 domain-containing protein [Nocardioides faecalis]